MGGKCTSVADLKLISEHCRRLGVHVHMDGARLWEALVYYCDPDLEDALADIKEFCSLFDTIYVSFYKGIAHEHHIQSALHSINL